MEVHPGANQRYGSLFEKRSISSRIIDHVSSPKRNLRLLVGTSALSVLTLLLLSTGGQDHIFSRVYESQGNTNASSVWDSAKSAVAGITSSMDGKLNDAKAAINAGGKASQDFIEEVKQSIECYHQHCSSITTNNTVNKEIAMCVAFAKHDDSAVPQTGVCKCAVCNSCVPSVDASKFDCPSKTQYAQATGYSLSAVKIPSKKAKKSDSKDAKTKDSKAKTSHSHASLGAHKQSASDAAKANAVIVKRPDVCVQLKCFSEVSGLSMTQRPGANLTDSSPLSCLAYGINATLGTTALDCLKGPANNTALTKLRQCAICQGCVDASTKGMNCTAYTSAKGYGPPGASFGPQTGAIPGSSATPGSSYFNFSKYVPAGAPGGSSGSGGFNFSKYIPHSTSGSQGGYDYSHFIPGSASGAGAPPMLFFDSLSVQKGSKKSASTPQQSVQAPQAQYSPYMSPPAGSGSPFQGPGFGGMQPTQPAQPSGFGGMQPASYGPPSGMSMGPPSAGGSSAPPFNFSQYVPGQGIGAQPASYGPPTGSSAPSSSYGPPGGSSPSVPFNYSQFIPGQGTSSSYGPPSGISMGPPSGASGAPPSGASGAPAGPPQGGGFNFSQFIPGGSGGFGGFNWSQFIPGGMGSGGFGPPGMGGGSSGAPPLTKLFVDNKKDGSAKKHEDSKSKAAVATAKPQSQTAGFGPSGYIPSGFAPPSPKGGFPQGPPPGVMAGPPSNGSSGYPQGPPPGITAGPPSANGASGSFPQGPPPGVMGGSGFPQGPPPGVMGSPSANGAGGSGFPQGPPPGVMGAPSANGAGGSGFPQGPPPGMMGPPSGNGAGGSGFPQGPPAGMMGPPSGNGMGGGGFPQGPPPGVMGQNGASGFPQGPPPGVMGSSASSGASGSGFPQAPPSGVMGQATSAVPFATNSIPYFGPPASSSKDSSSKRSSKVMFRDLVLAKAKGGAATIPKKSESNKTDSVMPQGGFPVPFGSSSQTPGNAGGPPQGVAQFSQPPPGIGQFSQPPPGIGQFSQPPAGIFGQPPAGVGQFSQPPPGIGQFSQPPANVGQFSQPFIPAGVPFSPFGQQQTPNSASSTTSQIPFATPPTEKLP